MMMDARSNGFDDVLWLLDDYVKEMTVLNVFALLKSRYGELELVTPPNDGCIFNGTERKTIIDLADEIYKEYSVVAKVINYKKLNILFVYKQKQKHRFVTFFVFVLLKNKFLFTSLSTQTRRKD